MFPCQNAQLQRIQQVQAAVLAEAIHLRGVSSLDPLATTDPAIPIFDIRPDPPAYRSSQVELLKAQLGISGVPLQEQALISANFTGRYGTCILASSIVFPTASEFSEKYSPFKQSILHGGLSLRNLPLPYEDLHGTYLDPSKPDAAVSWRRKSTTNSVLNSF